MKVWENLVRKPGEMLHRRKDGAFFTHTPVDMWEAINQHIALATATASPVLHVMIAEKVVPPLMEIFESIIHYVRTFNAASNPSLREIELEYVAALANDTALHIENVIELIDTFTLEKTKEKIDEIFDPLTNSLVNCGEACLKRLASLVMSDVQQVLQKVFTVDWLDGGEQVQVVTATISDYLNDFEEYLREFWSEKFVYIILQEALLCYIRCILQFPIPQRSGGVETGDSSPSVSSNSNSASAAFVQLALGGGGGSSSSGGKRCSVDPETLGRLAQDGNAWNAFFCGKAGQEVATEFLEIVNEVSLLLFLPPEAFTAHCIGRMKEFPSAAAAIRCVAAAIMKMRPADFSSRRGADGPSVDEFFRSTQEAVEAAPRLAQENEANGVAEGRLSCLLTELVPLQVMRSTAQQAAAAVGSSGAAAAAGAGSAGDGGSIASGISSIGGGIVKSSQNFLAQKRNLLSHIPLFGSSRGKGAAAVAVAASSAADDDEEEEAEADDEEEDDDEGDAAASGSGSLRMSSADLRRDSSASNLRQVSISGLVDNVLEHMNEQEAEYEEAMLREEREREQLEAIRTAVGVLSYEGYLEKKSPATNLWQVLLSAS